MSTLNLYSREKYNSRYHGFSLVELMIVIVIIGVLAAVAVPIYNNSVIKAKQAEADGALASIRRQLNIYKGEHGEYPKEVHNEYVIGGDWAIIKPGELTGKYFSDSSYTYRSPNRQQYTLICAKGNVLESDRTLDEEGIFGYD